MSNPKIKRTPLEFAKNRFFLKFSKPTTVFSATKQRERQIDRKIERKLKRKYGKQSEREKYYDLTAPPTKETSFKVSWVFIIKLQMGNKENPIRL
jgi:hypothetical protein